MMDKSREQFEAWFNRDVFSLKLADEKLVNCYWDAWQASRAEVEIELPPLMQIEEPGISFCAYGRAGVLNAIYEQGLKVVSK